MKRNLRAKEGYLVTECEGCQFGPVRDDGTEQRGQYNWLLTCSVCQGRRCLTCLPPDRTICNACAAKALAA